LVATGQVKLEMKEISIAFPGVQALSSVNFQMLSGTSHALIGANGAGKSTLMKVLAGAYDHYTGRIELDGQELHIRKPKDSKDYGIQIVYQEVDTLLIPNLSVAENIMLEHLVHDADQKSFVNWKRVHREAAAIMDQIGFYLPTNKLVQELTLAEKQLVLIARAVSMKCKFLILDEPTAPLSDSETSRLFTLIERLKKEGVGIIFISHRLPELFQICDDITILRDGKLVISAPINSMNQVTVAQHMLGAQLDGQFPTRQPNVGELAFEVVDIADDDKVHGVSLRVHKGEIVGIAGLVGAGKTELCRILFGAAPKKRGEVRKLGKVLSYSAPHQAVAHGLAMIPEERRREGIFVEEMVGVNLTIANLTPHTSVRLWLNKAKERMASYSMIEKLGIKTPSEKTLVANLSGGNQQKIAIGKWLLADAEVYIFDEPTKGVDVGAKRDIYNLITELASQGKSVIFASSETNEMIGITDRMYVMYDGKVAKELVTAQSNEEEIMFYSTGGQTS